MKEKLELNQLTEAIIGAAIEVHRQLGPELFESVYRKCLAFELRKRGYEVIKKLKNTPFQSFTIRRNTNAGLGTESFLTAFNSALSAPPRFNPVPRFL